MFGFKTKEQKQEAQLKKHKERTDTLLKKIELARDLENKIIHHKDKIQIHSYDKERTRLEKELQKLEAELLKQRLIFSGLILLSAEKMYDIDDPDTGKPLSKESLDKMTTTELLDFAEQLIQDMQKI